MGVKLTALVCVQNQEARLAECLRSLAFCDQIVVVADRCTDRSMEVARRAGAEVVAGIFPLEHQRKRAGLAATTGEWVLEIEPEELVDSALAWEIRATLKLGAEAGRLGDHFEIPIHHYLGDESVRLGWAGVLGEASAVRLYRPGVKCWRACRRDVGEVVSGRSAGELKGGIRRLAGGGLTDLVAHFNHLTALRAEDLADGGDPGRLGQAVFRGVAAFFKSYLVRGGWQEGGVGLALGLLSGFFPVVAHLKARETLLARLLAATAPQAGYGAEVVGLGAR